jgi:hypothetical protein
VLRLLAKSQEVSICNTTSFVVVQSLSLQARYLRWLGTELRGGTSKAKISLQVQQEWSVPKQHNLHWHLELEHMLQQTAGTKQLINI